MNRFVKFFAAFSLVEWIGRNPGYAAGVLALLGCGTGAGIAMFTPPTLTPFYSANFNPNKATTNNALKPNGGLASSMYLPDSTAPTKSFALYWEMTVNPALAFASVGVETPFNGMGVTVNDTPGQPMFTYQRTENGSQPTSYWWMNPGPFTGGSATSPNLNYAVAFAPFTAPTTPNCTGRQPTAVWINTIFQQVDPGLGCPISTPTLSAADIAANVPNSGAQVPTLTTTCAVVGGQAQVTSHTTLTHGLAGGLTYPMTGFTPAGYGFTALTVTALTGHSLTVKTMTTSASVTLQPGQTVTSAASGFPTSVTVTTGGTGTSFAVTSTTPQTLATGGGFVNGQTYEISFAGTTNFVSLYGASSNAIGVAFTANSTPSTGTGAAFATYSGSASSQATPITYTAQYGTGGNTLVGSTGASSCPGAVTSEGLALGGTGGAITFPAVSTTVPFTNGATGITTKNNQHICAWMVENGSDSTFPGSNAIEMVDEKGVALSGSPVAAMFLNQGTSTFIGGTSGAVLTVSALNPFTFSGTAANNFYDPTTGLAHFQVSTNPAFVPGSEFTVSGVSNTGSGSFNLSYITTAISGSGPYLITANPLSGPAGIPQASALSGSSVYTAGGTLVSVILPGQNLASSSINSSALILPYGTNGTTATATSQIGTYALNQTPAAPITSGSTIFAYAAFYYSAVTSASPAGGVATPRVQTGTGIGEFLSFIGNSSANVSPLTSSGWGGSIGNLAMLWGKVPQTVGAQGTPRQADLASICTKQTDIQQYAATQTAAGTPLAVHTLYRLNDLGIFGDSSDATITGYLDTASGTSAGTATLHVLTTPFGSLALASGTQTANLTGVGLPVAAPVTLPLTTSAGASYTVTFPTGVTSFNLGSSGSPMTFSVGAFKPALPIQSQTFKGYIDTTAGVTKLHVTSFDDGVAHIGHASFTGTLGTTWTASIAPCTGSNGCPTNNPTTGVAQGLMTVTAPAGAPQLQNAYVGIGTVVSPPVGSSAFTPTTVVGYAVAPATPGAGYPGSYVVDVSQTVTSQAMYGSGILPGPATTLQASGAVGTLVNAMVVTDGGASITGAPLILGSGSGAVWPVGVNYYNPINADATMEATVSSVVPGQYVQNAAITNPVKVVSFAAGANGLLGDYVLSGPPNSTGGVGSSGSLATFFGTTITDGGAIAPGPALTIDDKGPGVTFPEDYSTGLGPIVLSGKYDSPTLGGTPSSIQALVSYTAGGAPIPGCTPCNWGTLSLIAPATSVVNTIASTWKGSLAGIPAGGPYFVSVRASNGAAYSTLPNSIRVGSAYAVWGNGQVAGFFSAGGAAWTGGLWETINQGTDYGAQKNESYVSGPPLGGGLLAQQPLITAGDRYGISASGGAVSESVISFDQSLNNSLGSPTTIFYAYRDGVGMALPLLGNTPQTQTVGLGDGSKTVWCSATTLCSNVDVGFPLTYNAAAMTGGWFSAGTIAFGSGSLSSTSVFTAGTRQGGALEPGMVLNTANSPTLVRCLTGCSASFGIAFGGSTWVLSNTLDNGAAPTLATAPAALLPFGATSPPMLYDNVQQSGSTSVAGNMKGFGWTTIKAGTFQISVDGAVVCQDSAVFAYNSVGGNCTGAGVSGFVNYETGDYQVNFATAPTSGAVVIASWTNIDTPQNFVNSLSRVQNVDFMGTGDKQSGYVSSQFSRLPGGVSAHFLVSNGSDLGYIANNLGPQNGYEYGAPAYSQSQDWLFHVKFPALIPGSSAAVPVLPSGILRVQQPFILFNNPAFGGENQIFDQWGIDAGTRSTFSGTVSGSVLSLTTNAVGPMWEGEILGCVTVSSACPIGLNSATYITGLASGAWGASGSTYNLSTSPTGITSAQPMQNAVYIRNALAPSADYFPGELNDIMDFASGSTPALIIAGAGHSGGGAFGIVRSARRWAAMIWCHNVGNCTDPQLSRANDSASSTPSPAFDYGATYQASHAATWTGNTVTISGGLAAHARPFVVGQVVSCSSCASGLVITALSVPPTQDARAGHGEVGQTFTFTAKNAAGAAIGGSGTGTITAGCTTGSGGSNCINIDFSVSVGTALDTCGANNLNGSAPNYAVASGICQGNGIGELVRTFHIGTAQESFGDGTGSVPPAVGTVYDDGIDLASSRYTTNAAFTCNLVAAKTFQCVHGPTYTSLGVLAVGKWTGGSTYLTYGDSSVVAGRMGTLYGYVGGQSFPITTAGSGYTPGTYTVTLAGCTLIGATTGSPMVDVTVDSTGGIVRVVPANATAATGLGASTSCTVSTASITGGSGGAIPNIVLGPLEGVGGIGTNITDNNSMGLTVYDNSGEVGGTLNQFMTNGMGGYWEPGLPVRGFGFFQAAVVSN